MDSSLSGPLLNGMNSERDVELYFGLLSVTLFLTRSCLVLRLRSLSGAHVRWITFRFRLEVWSPLPVRTHGTFSHFYPAVETVCVLAKADLPLIYVYIVVLLKSSIVFFYSSPEISSFAK